MPMSDAVLAVHRDVAGGGGGAVLTHECMASEHSSLVA